MRGSQQLPQACRIILCVWVAHKLASVTHVPKARPKCVADQPGSHTDLDICPVEVSGQFANRRLTPAMQQLLDLAASFV